jgi:hypothetical protein
LEKDEPDIAIVKKCRLLVKSEDFVVYDEETLDKLGKVLKETREEFFDPDMNEEIY